MSIRRFEHGDKYIEFRPLSGYAFSNYECRTGFSEGWKPGLFESSFIVIKHCISWGYKEVPYSDPALKMQHNPLDALAASGNCCGGPTFYGGVTKNGKSHALDCPEISKPKEQLDFSMVYTPATTNTHSTGKKCGCGSTAVGSDRHSDYCDLYVARG